MSETKVIHWEPGMLAHCLNGSAVSTTAYDRRYGDFVRCRCGCGEKRLHHLLIAPAAIILAEFEAAGITVNCGVRCAKHNAAVGGAEHSYHLPDTLFADTGFMGGAALDLGYAHMDGKVKYTLIKRLFALGFTGIIVYPTFVHADVRTMRNYFEHKTK